MQNDRERCFAGAGHCFSRVARQVKCAAEGIGAAVQQQLGAVGAAAGGRQVAVKKPELSSVTPLAGENNPL